MQVQQIQNNNTFTSKVNLNLSDIHYLGDCNSVANITKGVKKLQNNRQEDTVFLSLDRNDGVYDPELIMNVVKKVGKSFVAGKTHKFIDSKFNSGSMEKMYNDATKDMQPIEGNTLLSAICK